MTYSQIERRLVDYFDALGYETNQEPDGEWEVIINEDHALSITAMAYAVARDTAADEQSTDLGGTK